MKCSKEWKKKNKEWDNLLTLRNWNRIDSSANKRTPGNQNVEVEPEHLCHKRKKKKENTIVCHCKDKWSTIASIIFIFSTKISYLQLLVQHQEKIILHCNLYGWESFCKTKEKHAKTNFMLWQMPKTEKILNCTLHFGKRTAAPVCHMTWSALLNSLILSCYFHFSFLWIQFMKSFFFPISLWYTSTWRSIVKLRFDWVEL